MQKSKIEKRGLGQSTKIKFFDYLAEGQIFKKIGIWAQFPLLAGLALPQGADLTFFKSEKMKKTKIFNFEIFQEMKNRVSSVYQKLKTALLKF